jgi:hypothetical protein
MLTVLYTTIYMYNDDKNWTKIYTLNYGVGIKQLEAQPTEPVSLT